MGTATLSFGPKLGLVNNQAVGQPYYDQFRPFLRAIDSLLQGSVLSTAVTVPPSSPNNGDAYLLLGAPSGVWTGKTNQVAVWSTQVTQAGSNILAPAWDFYVPNPGWLIWAGNLDAFLYYDGTGWVDFANITSIALAMPAEFVVTGSPLTANGTFTVTKASQSPNFVYASPSSGSGAPLFRSLVTADLPAGTGTVTSVSLAVPSRQGVSGSPITTNGTIAIVDNVQNANLVFASPASGAAATPQFRSIVPADLPVATTSALGVVKPDGSTITISGGTISAASGGGVAGTGTTGYVPAWTGTSALGDSHIDDGVTLPGVLTSSQQTLAVSGSVVTATLGAKASQFAAAGPVPFSLTVADASYAGLGVIATDSTYPWAHAIGFACGAGILDSPPSSIVSCYGYDFIAEAEFPMAVGLAGQIYIVDQVTSGFVGIRNLTPAYQLDVGGDVNSSGAYRVSGNIIIPSTATGYHGSGAGDIAVQLSDGTGASGHIAVFDANGGLTDGGSAGTGTVTSVALTVPSWQTVSGTPVTTSGTLAVTDNTQTANTVFAGSASGDDAAPTFRAIVPADLPAATSSALGAVQPDNSTITISDGVISVVPALTLSSLSVIGTSSSSLGLLLENATAATSDANQSSNLLEMSGQYWNGSASAGDSWTVQAVLGSGANPATTLTVGHSGGTSGMASVAIPFPVATGGLIAGGSPSISVVSGSGWSVTDALGGETAGTFTLNWSSDGDTTATVSIGLPNAPNGWVANVIPFSNGSSVTGSQTAYTVDSATITFTGTPDDAFSISVMYSCMGF